MEEKRLIIGTAGHIDHGKTSLIQALTGYDCDTHREEKQRGITIHLGFTHLKLPDNLTVGVIDVPGHAEFIKTMVAGVSGIDFVMLVVAADSGVMPQTCEHLQILTVLGVTAGFIVLTKCDLVDDDILEMAQEEVREAVAGTFLSGAPVLCVSSKTGEGIEALREALAAHVTAAKGRPDGEVFRMFIDRIFSVPGIGTVTTGSVLSGSLQEDSTVYLLPGDKELRVRKLERFGMETKTVRAGDRAAINLVSLNREDFERGMVLSDRRLRSTRMIDARMMLFTHAKALNLWTTVLFQLGTYEAQARIHLLNCNQTGENDEVLAQIHLPKPCTAQIGDRFVIRSTSADVTLGGGEVIDAFPLHHRRRREKLMTHLQTIASGSLPHLISAEIRKLRRAATSRLLADTLNMDEAEIIRIVQQEKPDDLVLMDAPGGLVLDTEEGLLRTKEMILRSIQFWHKRNALDERGPKLGDILGSSGRLGDTASEVEFRFILQQMEHEKTVVRTDNTWASADHKVDISPELRQQISAVRHYITHCGMETPLMSELRDIARRHSMNEKELFRILRHIVSCGDAYQIDGNYIPSALVDKARKDLLSALKQRPEGLTVAGFRDLIGGNRKICLLLLAQFDSEGVTERRDDVRIITPKGIQFLEKQS
ncbi:MAG: selenocysteine-specific translation elongation factor [Pontiellaceae bacterium]|jgi:selenocysteine-specific elongation factor|nr:selenocysteine-specific translation elongation factor [Pontiellaceae bacterium]